jgi:lysine-N-methylase
MSNQRPLPLRPRLADHVLARRHVVSREALEAREELVILHDTRAGRLIQVGKREWGLIAAADGTRDIDGIVIAASREGSHARAPALRAFLEQLHSAGMLADGARDEDPPAASPAVPPDRPLDPLPGFSLRCDGSGSCCRIYASVLFSPIEVVRARAALPDVLDAGARRSNAFLPEHGSAPCAASAVTLVDGRCAYLADDGLCAIHAAAGARRKPLGCQLFPATFIDDGEAVRVSVAVECACVLASGARAHEGGEPLLPPGARVRADLDSAVFIAEVPHQVRTAGASAASRAELVAWSRAVMAAQAAPSAAPRDSLAELWSLAAEVEASGLDARGARRCIAEARAPRAHDVLPWIDALRLRAAKKLREDLAWRSARDLAGRAARWIEAAASLLLEPGACDAALHQTSSAADDDRLASEAFYVRAILHGHQLVAVAPPPDADGSPSWSADPPLAVALRDRAVRLLIARAMPEAVVRLEAHDPPVPSDPAAARPLALVEAMLRGHGLEGYAALP